MSFFSPILGQENSAELRTKNLLSQIYSLPNLPKLEPVIIRIDKTEKRSYAYYQRRPKRFFGLKTLKTPEIHISEKFLTNFSDEAILVSLAHELGHHFDTRPKFSIEIDQKKPLDNLLEKYEKEEKDQYFAEAFALYVLGEELYKKGRFDFALTSIKEQKGVYWLYINKNPILLKYYLDQTEVWVNYSTAGAKSRLDNVVEWIDLADLF